MEHYPSIQNLISVKVDNIVQLLCIRDHEKLGFSSHKYHPKTSLMTAWQHWLVTAKPKIVFDQHQTIPKSFYGNSLFFFFYLTE